MSKLIVCCKVWRMQYSLRFTESVYRYLRNWIQYRADNKNSFTSLLIIIDNGTKHKQQQILMCEFLSINAKFVSSLLIYIIRYHLLLFKKLRRTVSITTNMVDLLISCFHTCTFGCYSYGFKEIVTFNNTVNTLSLFTIISFSKWIRVFPNGHIHW